MTDIAAAGATPVVGGATPPQTPAQPAATTPQAPGSATDYPDGMGDPGKRALDAMKAERDAARREAADARRKADELENAGKSEHERAVAEAKKAGELEASSKYGSLVRRSEVKAALLSAGVDPTLIEIASRADQFASLKVSDSGEVDGLDAAVDAFRKATPSLFARQQPRSTGDAGLGPRGSSSASSPDMNTLIRRAAGRA
jgi:hypothetical protein